MTRTEGKGRERFVIVDYVSNHIAMIAAALRAPRLGRRLYYSYYEGVHCFCDRQHWWRQRRRAYGDSNSRNHGQRLIRNRPGGAKQPIVLRCDDDVCVCVGKGGCDGSDCDRGSQIGLCCVRCGYVANFYRISRVYGHRYGNPGDYQLGVASLLQVTLKVTKLLIYGT